MESEECLNGGWQRSSDGGNTSLKQTEEAEGQKKEEDGLLECGLNY